MIKYSVYIAVIEMAVHSPSQSWTFSIGLISLES